MTDSQKSLATSLANNVKYTKENEARVDLSIKPLVIQREIAGLRIEEASVQAKIAQLSRIHAETEYEQFCKSLIPPAGTSPSF